jgi:alkylation response protein AidB-like acyl-CoA dehydrogenase
LRACSEVFVSDYRVQLSRIIKETVLPEASRVDREGTFPAKAVEALGASGLFGLISAKEVGGMGFGARAATEVVERLSRECGSTAMVVCMHYAGTAVLEAFGSEALRRQVATGRHPSTLAFSEVGSRSHFWAPLGTAQKRGSTIVLNGQKSWVTSASHASAYIWSSCPLQSGAPSTLWIVPGDSRGLTIGGTFDGLGLRGNDSTPVTAEEVVVPEDHRLGEDGAAHEKLHVSPGRQTRSRKLGKRSSLHV